MPDRVQETTVPSNPLFTHDLIQNVPAQYLLPSASHALSTPDIAAFFEFKHAPHSLTIGPWSLTSVRILLLHLINLYPFFRTASVSSTPGKLVKMQVPLQ